MYFGAANRAATKFESPDVLDRARGPNEHIAFGGGSHVCLGQDLEGLEIDAVLTEVLTQMKNLQVIGSPEWLASTLISGPKRIPIRFAPGPRR